MDEIVKQALIKWPHVPHCYGWLGLDARGRWYLRDGAVQAQGGFPESRGTLLEHEKLLGFMGRNYEPDEKGCWFFQNGPQRVYVELEAAPWVLRLQATGVVQTHTGLAVDPRLCLVDEWGWAYLASPQGLGLVHSLDTGLLVQWLEQKRWPVEEIQRDDLARRYGFVLSPWAEQQKRA